MVRGARSTRRSRRGKETPLSFSFMLVLSVSKCGVWFPPLPRDGGRPISRNAPKSQPPYTVTNNANANATTGNTSPSLECPRPPTSPTLRVRRPRRRRCRRGRSQV
ncbi:hypothetical protein K439DRAFT_112394 [Ramaria rubella]|nr:hypothetical protein K439DRAFT_112394 [Ramaria rubella]